MTTSVTAKVPVDGRTMKYLSDNRQAYIEQSRRTVNGRAAQYIPPKQEDYRHVRTGK